jgi:hypothetical protein
MRPGAGFASSLLLLFATVSRAHAGDELYLRWDNCIGDGGVYNRTFACDTNLGAETLVGSFRLDQDLAEMTSIQAYLAISTLDPINLPSWWTFGTGQCRLANALSARFNPPPASTNCLDGWAGRAVGGVSWTLQYPYNEARIGIVAAMPAPASFAALAGQEVYAFTVSISHARTVGLGSCAGCSAPACIAFGHAGLSGPSFTHPWIVGSATPKNGSNVTWQSGAVATTSGTCQPYGNCTSHVICQSETPARGHTWGAIKSLYR